LELHEHYEVLWALISYPSCCTHVVSLSMFRCSRHPFVTPRTATRVADRVRTGGVRARL